MPTLSSEAYVCDARPDYPLLITAKRYWIPELSSTDADALTLIVTHGTGYHKEQWEPTIEHLYEYLAQANGEKTGIRIRDIWSVDCPNHGEAAVLNERTLQWGYNIFNWEEYARAVHILLSGLGKGVNVDFSTRNLVGVGHSMGAVALILSNTFHPKPLFKSFIFAEPMCFPPDPYGLPDKFTIFLTTGAEKRRDIFSSREEALAWLQSRAGFKVWDSRVLRAFVDHGMRDLPSLDYPDKEGVTLKCTRAQEAACYRDHTNTGRVRAYQYLSVLCATYPVHILYGAIDDYIPSKVKDYVLSDGTKGRHASARRVSDSGHLMVQTQPRGLAKGIWAVLSGEPAPQENSKL